MSTRSYAGVYFVAVGGNHSVVRCNGAWHRPGGSTPQERRDALVVALAEASEAEGRAPRQLKRMPLEVSLALQKAYLRLQDRDAAWDAAFPSLGLGEPDNSHRKTRPHDKRYVDHLVKL